MCLYGTYNMLSIFFQIDTRGYLTMRAWADKSELGSQSGKTGSNSRITNRPYGNHYHQIHQEPGAIRMRGNTSSANCDNSGFGKRDRFDNDHSKNLSASAGYNSIRIDSTEDWDNDLDIESSQANNYQSNDQHSQSGMSNKQMGLGHGSSHGATTNIFNTDESSWRSRVGSSSSHEQSNFTIARSRGRGRSVFERCDGVDGQRVGLSQNEVEDAADNIDVPSKEIRIIIGITISLSN